MKKNSASDTLVRETLRVYYKAAQAHKPDLVLSLLNMFGAVMMSVAVPYAAGKVFAGLARHDSHLDSYIIILGVASFLGVMGNRIGFVRLMNLQAETMSDLHHLVFERLLKRSVGYHANTISGKLISDAIDFVTAFSTLVAATYNNALSLFAIMAIGILVVFVNSWELGIYLIIVVTIILIWTYVESRRRSKLRSRRLVANKNLTAHLSDTIVNAQTVKTFASEKTELAEGDRLNVILRDLRLTDWKRAGISGNNRIAVLLTMQFVMILFLVHLVRIHPQVLAAGFFAFTYTFTLTNRLFDLNTLTRQIEESFLQASPMTKMLLEDIEITDHKHATKLKVQGGDILFDDVTFAYTEKNVSQEVFTGLSLHINPGEKVGLVGPSGGGKSTLTRLLLRFDEADSGTIYIDDQAINEVTQVSLRKSISYVPQEPLLFHRSIRENIAYGKPDATQTQIESAAKKANAHNFIQALPHAYDTVVGERGVKLSGGQRQRIAIARAMLKDAPILILDEATSALDSENEQEVQQALWKLMQGRTVLVIAHRLSTIQRMDRIIVLADGAIIESGPHAELLKQEGMYAKLWKHQSGGFIEES